uniref:Uncharacterized protein n=1 Tax=Candidatus Kentrum sp. SD TaxID=2126332 RepID=A0A451BPA5_9GAMM|nr:MAG: hypothetical protein BECKSD772D_GA0070982_108512 [Candidatus Kentron sp. SD]
MLNANDFRIEEYKSLRAEIFEKVRETRILERYAILGTGVVWAWLLTTDTPNYHWRCPLRGLYLPFLAS